jgi:hypothetical protein
VSEAGRAEVLVGFPPIPPRPDASSLSNLPHTAWVWVAGARCWQPREVGGAANAIFGGNSLRCRMLAWMEACG